MSHADTGYRKTAKVESVLSESKLEKRLMVERNLNSADLCKRMDDRPIFPEITPNNNITDKIEDLKRKVRQCRSIVNCWNIKFCFGSS